MDGFYTIAFTGAAGSGFGVLALRNGKVVGADMAGGQFDGTYAKNPASGMVNFQIVVRIPAGTSPVQTGVPLAAPIELPIDLTTPEDFGGVAVTLVKTPIGAVNVTMRKIREFPAGF